NLGMPMWLTLIAIIGIGTLFGLINGVLVARFKLPSFIATLGTMMVARGVGSIVSNVNSVTFPVRGTEDGFYKSIFRFSDYSPVGIIVMVASATVAAVVLKTTKIAIYILAIGSNREATSLSGVNANKWDISAFVISGMSAGIAGIAYAATYTPIFPAEAA